MRRWNGNLHGVTTVMADGMEQNRFEGMAPLVERYRCLILDLWGVVHDGRHVFPEADDCLAQLRSHGVRLAVISNTSRGTSNLCRLLETIGLDPAHFDCILSAGELARLTLARRRGPKSASLGDRCLVLGDRCNIEWLEALDLSFTEDPCGADFLLAVGILRAGETLDSHEQTLREAAAAHLPMVCANPDRVVVIDGTPCVAAGAVAARYENVGGRVTYFGKPFPEVYRWCLSTLAETASGTAAVGDSLITDIAGAAGVGLDTIFVSSTGVHAQELALSFGGPPDLRRLSQLCSDVGVTPTATIPAFRW